MPSWRFSLASWTGFAQRSLEVGAVDAAVSTHWADGGRGAEQLAEAVLKATEPASNSAHLYDALLVPQEENRNHRHENVWG